MLMSGRSSRDSLPREASQTPLLATVAYNARRVTAMPSPHNPYVWEESGGEELGVWKFERNSDSAIYCSDTNEWGPFVLKFLISLI